MTLEIDEKFIAATLDGMKRISEARDSTGNPYGRIYADYLNAYSDLGLYITVIDGHHVVVKSSEM